MTTAYNLLGGLSPAEFLREYWQKKPLLVRGAFPDFQPPLTPEDLAGIACEEEVSARLIMEEGGAYPWQVQHGPFQEEDFAELPASHWTLLVQEVDRFVPEVAEILKHFRFIPSWRIDDIMVSYAPKDGGVGAHIDNYDVFLLQGLGHRRWQISHSPVTEEILVPEMDIRLLQDFQPDADWVLAPGDMLYLPPRIAHYGVALDDCMTYSIGFRAPSHVEILEGFLGYVAQQTDPLLWYSDPDLIPPFHFGELNPVALDRVREVIYRTLKDERIIKQWFGRYATEDRRGREVEPPEEAYTTMELRAALENGAWMVAGPFTRSAFYREPDGSASLFLNGREFRMSSRIASAAPVLTSREDITREALESTLDDPDMIALLVDLVNEGYYEIASDEDDE